MTELVRYEQARTALAECNRVDEVKDIRDKAEAMAAYARQAKDTDLIKLATEIKVRAERKAGEMLTESKERGELFGKAESGRRGAAIKHGKSDEPTRQSTLTELGISKDQSANWQRLAAMPEEHFEACLEKQKTTAGAVTTAHMLREANKARPLKRMTKKDKERVAEVERQQALGISMLSTYARLLLTMLRTQSTYTEAERTLLAEVREEIHNVSETAKG